MNIETTLARSIRVYDRESRYDAACKSILANKFILAWILKSCISEFRNYDVEDIAEYFIEGSPNISQVALLPDETVPSTIRGSNTEDSTFTEGTVTYDIKFYVIVPNSDQSVQMIIDVEAQNKFHPGYPLVSRGIFYDSRMISSQYGVEFQNDHYEKIKKVHSIWICTNPPNYMANTISTYQISERSLIGNVQLPVKDYDLLSIILICLGHKVNENYKGVIKLLDVLFTDQLDYKEKQMILEDEFHIPMTQQFKEEISNMCNLSQGIKDKGIAIGKSQGIAIGEVRGIAIGEEQTIVASIKALVETTGWSVEQAMNALKLSEEKRIKYLNMFLHESVNLKNQCT